MILKYFKIEKNLNFEVLQNQHFKYYITEKRFHFEVDNFKKLRKRLILKYFKMAKTFDFEVLQNQTLQLKHANGNMYMFFGGPYQGCTTVARLHC